MNVNKDSLSEEELQRVANLPAMIYYGVNSDEAILMRMDNVPRSVTAEMELSTKRNLIVFANSFLMKLDNGLKDYHLTKWETFAENKR